MSTYKHSSSTSKAPHRWTTTPLRYAAICLDGRRIPLNTEERSKRQGDYPYWGANGVLDAVDDYIFDEPLVLLGEDGAPFFDKSKSVAFFVTGKIWVNNHIHVLRVSPKFDPRFLVYALNATDYAPFIDGSTRDKLTQEKMGDIRLSTPDLSIQRAIADYLDRETGRIDALIAAKERLLALLTEKRRALITRAVTRGLPAEAAAQAGLDPTAPLRDSGIPWLGQIPAHWEICHLKRVLESFDYGISAIIEPAGNIAVLRMGDIQDGEIDYTNVGFVDEVEERFLLRPGDLIFNRTNSLDQIGKVALFRELADYSVSFASYLVRLRCSPRALPEYLNWLLNSTFALAWGRGEALPAIGQANLNPNRYGYLPIALPPITEQRAIVEHIARETGKLDATRAATERSIALLKERRAALIAAAVTGEIEVEGAG